MRASKSSAAASVEVARGRDAEAEIVARPVHVPGCIRAPSALIGTYLVISYANSMWYQCS